MIKRTFTHRTYGLVGEVTLDATATMKLNGKELGAASVEYLLNFALQSLQDAYAGAKNLEEAKGSFNKKLEALIAGTIGTRTAGTSVSDETRISRNIVKNALKAKMGAKSEEWATFTGLSDDDQAKKLDELFGRNKDKLQPRVDEELAALQAERARKAKLAKSMDLDI